MTAQISDTFYYQDERFDLKGDLDTFVHPGNWGMKPVMIHTGCYRGYYAEIAVEEGRLLLKTLTVRDADDNYPEINGVNAETSRHGEQTYNNLDLVIEYSGELIAAKDFDSRLYQHMGFHPLSAYGTHLYLKLDAGVVQEARLEQHDTSKAEADEPGESVRDWIRDRFDRDRFKS